MFLFGPTVFLLGNIKMYCLSLFKRKYSYIGGGGCLFVVTATRVCAFILTHKMAPQLQAG
jgi:hypothetical protein